MSAPTESVNTPGPCIVVTGAAGFIGSCVVIDARRRLDLLKDEFERLAVSAIHID